MKRMDSLSSIAAAVALACVAPFALAQTSPASTQHPQSGAITHTPPFQTPPPQDKTQPQNADQTAQAQPGQVMGQHDMRGMVESVGQDGMVKVRTAEGTLKVHFPEASQHLKKGDTITLHLAYTVDETVSSGSSSP